MTITKTIRNDEYLVYLMKEYSRHRCYIKNWCRSIGSFSESKKIECDTKALSSYVTDLEVFREVRRILKDNIIKYIELKGEK